MAGFHGGFDDANRPLALTKKGQCEVGVSVIKRLLRPKADTDPYPTLETLVKLATALDITVFELVIDAHDMRSIVNSDRSVMPKGDGTREDLQQ